MKFQPAQRPVRQLKRPSSLTVSGLQPVLGNANVAIFLMNAHQQLEFRVAAGFENINFTEEKITREDSMLMKSFTSLEPILLRTGETASTTIQYIPVGYADSLSILWRAAGVAVH